MEPINNMAHLEKKIVEKTKLLIELMRSDNWQHIVYTSNIIYEKLAVPGNKLYCFRANGYVNHPPEKLFQHVWNSSHHENDLKKFDILLNKHELLEEVSDDVKIFHQLRIAQWPIKTRDVVYLQTRIKIENDNWILVFSIDYDGIKNHHVRANIHIYAYGFVANNCGTQLYCISHIDPCGMIPSVLINNHERQNIDIIIKSLRTIFP